MILPQEPDLLIEKDIHGVIRELRHLQTPAEGEPGEPARKAAIDYLTLAVDRGLAPLTPDDLEHLRDTIESGKPPESGKAGFRWSPSRELKRSGQNEATIVWCQQTVSIRTSPVAIHLQGSSIGLVVHHRQQNENNRSQVTSARLTTLNRSGLSVDAPKALRGLAPDSAGLLPEDFVVAQLGPVLGLNGRTVAIADQRLVAYLPREAVDLDSELGVAISATVFLPVASGDSIAHRVLFDLTTGTILRSAPIASACAGYAFLNDPVTKTGSFKLRPDSCADHLDPLRDPVALADLVHAGGGKRKLSGPRVEVRDPAALGKPYDPPEQVPPFAFSSRTNEFAAVSAYYHCDSMMQLIKGFGFCLHDIFSDVALPLTVEHRAKMLSGPGARDGRGINAYVTPFLAGQPERPWNVKMLFGLADFADTWKNPLGLAVDVRFVWHEFCHVLILAATGSTEFDFAHSAGDALAAIASDPASNLPAHWRGVTFPFVQLPMRRHDRDVTKGWGWNGTLYEIPNPTYGLRDPAGYNAEQILSSTLFRLYCAAGGNAVRPNQAGDCEPDLEVRRAAAYYILYLIVRAIASLGSILTQPTRDAGQFATALMEADIGTPYLDYEGARRPGGMLHKVVRWAFEKQGLYQTAPTGRQNTPGSPPPIDIYVDNGLGGEYGYLPGWQAGDDVVWVRRSADGRPEGETPYPGQPNYVYIILSNRGAETAVGASIDVFATVGDAADVWDTVAGYWQPLQGSNTTADVRPGYSVQFGPFEWTPEAGTRNSLLVRATVAGDRSNIDAGSNLPCATGPSAVADLVRTDNNLGYREWTLP
jgi:hypothetical protein